MATYQITSNGQSAEIVSKVDTVHKKDIFPPSKFLPIATRTENV
jgi:hypothetical protein